MLDDRVAVDRTLNAEFRHWIDDGACQDDTALPDGRGERNRGARMDDYRKAEIWAARAYVFDDALTSRIVSNRDANAACTSCSERVSFRQHWYANQCSAWRRIALNDGADRASRGLDRVYDTTRVAAGAKYKQAWTFHGGETYGARSRLTTIV